MARASGPRGEECAGFTPEAMSFQGLKDLFPLVGRGAGLNRLQKNPLILSILGSPQGIDLIAGGNASGY